MKLTTQQRVQACLDAYDKHSKIHDRDTTDICLTFEGASWIAVLSSTSRYIEAEAKTLPKALQRLLKKITRMENGE